MLTADIVVAGGGISGLLIASALAPQCSTILLEQGEQIPQNKFWLTNEAVVEGNPQFGECVNRRYEFMDFIANDGLTARVHGRYCLWDTSNLVTLLTNSVLASGGTILTGHRLYSVVNNCDEVVIRANNETLRASILVDCMGCGSPLIAAKDVVTIVGYYIVHGREVELANDIAPVGLDNVVIGRAPAYFELFPTAQGSAHAAIIIAARQHKPEISLSREFSFLIEKSHYSGVIKQSSKYEGNSYFGVVPVGKLKTVALDGVVFFGESGQANPAASATGLTRMLNTYQEAALGIVRCLRNGSRRRSALSAAMPPTMTRMNRAFQETLFESLLDFTSDDFRRLVEDLRTYPDSIVNDLIFAEFDFSVSHTAKLAADALFRPKGMLGTHVLKSFKRYIGLG